MTFKPYLIIAAIGIVLSILLGNRSFVVGFLIGFFVLTADVAKFSLKHIVVCLILLLLVFLLLTFGIKSDSSLGRLLIYKISFRVLKDNWLTGIGIGQYPIVYKNYQAAYFEAGKYTNKELLLADNNKFAFNDYFQFVIEAGVFGFVILTFLFWGLYRLYIVHRSPNKPANLLLAVAQSVSVAILVAAFFTHISDRLTIVIIFIVCLVIITYNVWQRKHFKEMGLYVIYLSLILVGCLKLNLTQIKRIIHKRQLNELSMQTGAGYLREAENGYRSLYPSMKNNPQYLFDFAALLKNREDYKSANFLLGRLIKIDNNSFNYMALGDCYWHLHQNQKAEYCYRQAVNITPNRFYLRYQLFHYYIETGNLTLAEKTGRSILDLPIKIASRRVDEIRLNVKKRLLEISEEE
ncbi:MAG: O-antigen ligase family protein [Chitinophagaceae bacterium]